MDSDTPMRTVRITTTICPLDWEKLAINSQLFQGDGGHGHSHGHSHEDGEEHSHDMTVGLGVLSGILAFLCVEKFVR